MADADHCQSVTVLLIMQGQVCFLVLLILGVQLHLDGQLFLLELLYLLISFHVPVIAPPDNHFEAYLWSEVMSA